MTVASAPWRPSDLLRLPRNRYEAFASLTGWAVVLQLLTEPTERSPWLLLAVIGGIGLSARPNSVFALTALLVAVAGRTLTDLQPPNGYWLLLTILTPVWLGLLWSTASRFRGWPTMTELGPRFTPSFRAAFVAGWIVVWWHQFNDTFLDVATSCATEFYRQGRNVLFFLPDAGGQAPGWLPVALIVVQGLIVFSLWITPLRTVPLTAALVFTVLLAMVEPTVAVPALGFLVLFMRDDVVDTGIDQLALLGRRLPLSAVALTVLGLLIMGAAFLRVVLGVVRDADVFSTTGPAVATVIAVATGVAVLGLFLAGVFGPAPLTETEQQLEWFGPVAMVVTIVVLGLGLTPYLGLGTAYALADYTNLRTEAGRWNHTVLPEQIDVFDTQAPLVRVLDPDHPGLGRLGDDLPVSLSRVEVVEGEVARRLAVSCDDPGASIPLSLARGTEVDRIDDPCADDAFESTEPWLLDRILAYRSVPQGDACLP